MSQKAYVLELRGLVATERALGHHLVDGTTLGQDNQCEFGRKHMPSECGHDIARGRCLRTRAKADPGFIMKTH